MKPDVVIGGGGTIYTVTPRTKQGEHWLSDNVASEPWQWLGGALCVEHRYIADLVDGMRADGLTVGGA